MILIIGYGNPLRGDDGAGWIAIQHLAQNEYRGVHLMACHQLTPELAEPISQADLVIFLDACWDHEHHQEAGTPRVVHQSVAADGTLSADLSHHLHPSALLAYAHMLYGTTPEAVVFTIASTSFGYGEQLSPGVLATMPVLIEEVQALVARSMAEP